MKIGAVELKSLVLLAPMAGVTDLPYRTICRELGCQMAYTEMVSAKGIFYKNERTESLLEVEAYHPVGAQIFGKEIDAIQQTVAFLVANEQIDVIDINMGCPAPKIARNGEGSALMRSPQKVGEIVKAAVAVAQHKPITVKIRKGWDDDEINAVEIAQIAEKNGASAVTVHGRTRKQFYSGAADYQIIKAVKGVVGIPVIGNGDIFQASDALRMLDETGCDAVMIARGIQGNPWLCQQVDDAIKGLPVKLPTIDERFDVMLHHIDYVVVHYGEQYGIPRMRKQMAWYLKGLPASSQLRGQLNTVKTYDEAVDLLKEYKQKISTNHA
jgi:tRNA-dihydrouridine synthase B